MKTINLELSKRLTPYLENIDTEYNWYYHKDRDWYLVERINHLTTRGIKTLTLEEAIEFIAKETDGFILTYHKSRIIRNEYYYNFMEKCKNGNIGSCIVSTYSLFEAIEKMLTYLLDNNLIEKGKKE